MEEEKKQDSITIDKLYNFIKILDKIAFYCLYNYKYDYIQTKTQGINLRTNNKSTFWKRKQGFVTENNNIRIRQVELFVNSGIIKSEGNNKIYNLFGHNIFIDSIPDKNNTKEELIIINKNDFIVYSDDNTKVLGNNENYGTILQNIQRISKTNNLFK